METKNFEQLIDGIRQQLEENHLDFILVVTNINDDKPVEGLVVIDSKHSLDTHADILFQAAQGGEVAPQHFIELIIERTITTVRKYLQNKAPEPTKNNPNVN